MRVSHEAIYHALYVQGRGGLRRELTACLRTGRALRVPRARSRTEGKSFVAPEVMISQRPAEAADRAVPGHWEGDLILGLGSSAIGTQVERTTRFTMLMHLPRMEGHGNEARVKNGPALAGHGAEAVREAIARTIATLPGQLRRSLTWDQGAEMAQHAQIRIDTGVAIPPKRDAGPPLCPNFATGTSRRLKSDAYHGSAMPAIAPRTHPDACDQTRRMPFALRSFLAQFREHPMR